jgi:polysaccharide biosynthesis/export protein
MKKLIVVSLKITLLIGIISVLFSSCVPQKKIKYLQKKEKEDTTSIYSIKQAADYKVQPNDNLYIRIYSLDEKTNTLFSRQQGSVTASGSYYSDASIYFESYTVSNEGYIDFPVIGKVYIKELTIEQTRSLIQQLVDEYLKETVVVVKIATYNITILGEVRNPGQYKIYQDKINVFEAVSKAGDLTDFADRNKVTLVRQVKNDSRVYRFDMTDEKFLNSSLYYLAPNDILYVAPLRSKQWGFQRFPYELLISSVAIIITVLTFIKVY